MDFIFSTADGGGVRLPPNAATVHASDLQVGLVLAADNYSRIEVDASGVESIGQAALQVLIAARKEAIANNQDFVIVKPSQSFVDRVTSCRLAEAVGLAIAKECLR